MTYKESLQKVQDLQKWGDRFEESNPKLFDWIRDEHPDWNEHWVFSSAYSMWHSKQTNPNSWNTRLIELKYKEYLESKK